ncbi:MAG TPA: dTDP-4-dehydrorhamnose reductase, partial [Sporomusaceae bacterium]|nr:dTDP-4-dehydrorhamnose reductase [Sporomusaceae bacterium]
MRVAVTGANGQLGKEIARQGCEYELILTDYDTLDVTDYL